MNDNRQSTELLNLGNSRIKQPVIGRDEENKMLWHALGVLNHLVIIFDMQWQIHAINVVAKKYLQQEGSPVNTTNFWLLFANQEQQVKPLVAQARSTQQRCCYEALCTDKQGKKKYIAWSFIPLGSDDDKLIAVGNDITESRYAETALRDRERQLGLLTDALPILVAYIDLEKRFRFVNQTFEFWFAFSHPSIVGKTIYEILGDAISQYIEKTLSGEAIKFEGVMPDNNGENCYISANCIPHLDEVGHVKGVMFLASDITEHNREERRKRARLVESAKVSRVYTVDEMTTALAHEINQPLCAISSYAQACKRMMMQGTGDWQEINNAIEAIVAESSRAGDIMRGIRRFVHRDVSRRESVDMNALIHDAVGLVESELNKYDAVVKLELMPQLSSVLADSVQIEQVIVNLIRNGLEAMVDVQQSIKAFVITSVDDGCLQVSISDCGSGVDPTIVDQVFEPFISTKPDGMGMGLSICRSIIESHGGRLWWMPKVGGGTTFTFSLPQSQSDCDNNKSNNTYC